MKGVYGRWERRYLLLVKIGCYYNIILREKITILMIITSQ